MFDLRSLGQRICIIGPSNSGKSTLAKHLGHALNLPIYHLDQIAHIPGTKWLPRPFKDFEYDHNLITQTNTWIIDGNYSRSMQLRFNHATSVIWIDAPLSGCVMRYLGRSIRNDPDRPGRLKDAQSEFSLGLIQYTLTQYPKNKQKYKEILSNYPFLNLIHLKSLKECKRLFYNS
jgi:adenylate kinase family enzyme